MNTLQGEKERKLIMCYVLVYLIHLHLHLYIWLSGRHYAFIDSCLHQVVKGFWGGGRVLLWGWIYLFLREQDSPAYLINHEEAHTETFRGKGNMHNWIFVQVCMYIYIFLYAFWYSLEIFPLFFVCVLLICFSLHCRSSSTTTTTTL